MTRPSRLARTIGTRQRGRRSPNRFTGEGEYNRYGKRRDDLRGVFKVKGSGPDPIRQKKPKGGE